MEVVALYLQISGFFLAAVTGALLKINFIRTVADSVKGYIVKISDLTSDKPVNVDSELAESVRMSAYAQYKNLTNSLFKVTKCLRQILTGVIRFMFSWGTSESARYSRKKHVEHIKMFFGGIGLNLKDIRREFKVLYLYLSFQTINNFQKVVESVARKLKGKDAITTIFFVIGTFAVFIGLVLELVAIL